MKTISDRVYRMVTREGFLGLFWEDLTSCRKLDPATSQRDVFEGLNTEYENEFGVTRFPSFEAFKAYKNGEPKKV